MRADLERAADGFRELGDDWALGDGALVAGRHADAGRRARRAPRPCSTRRASCSTTLNGAPAPALLRLRLADIRVRRGDLAGARELARARGRGRRPAAATRRCSSAAIRAGIAWLDGRPGRAARELADGARAAGAASAPARPSRATRRALVRRAAASSRSRTATSTARATRGRAGLRRGGRDDRHADRRRWSASSRRRRRCAGGRRRGRRRASSAPPRCCAGAEDRRQPRGRARAARRTRRAMQAAYARGRAPDAATRRVAAPASRAAAVGA